MTLLLLVAGVWLCGFVSGALLLGPAIYHRRLVRWVRRYATRQRLSPDDMRALIGELEGG